MKTFIAFLVSVVSLIMWTEQPLFNILQKGQLHFLPYIHGFLAAFAISYFFADRKIGKFWLFSKDDAKDGGLIQANPFWVPFIVLLVLAFFTVKFGIVGVI
jgi:hypothetical protein